MCLVSCNEPVSKVNNAEAASGVSNRFDQEQSIYQWFHICTLAVVSYQI